MDGVVLPDASLRYGRKVPEPQRGVERKEDQKDLREKTAAGRKSQGSRGRGQRNTRKRHKAVTKQEEAAKEDDFAEVHVIVNNLPVTLKGKSSYVFVDVFEYINFDLNAGNGRAVVTRLNGEFPSYMAELKEGDKVEVYWEE